MRNLKERLDQLRKEIQKPEFLEGKGLSNEVNIRIFCYDGKEEMTVNHFLEQMKTDQAMTCRLIECNLYKTFLGICEDLGITDAIPEMEVEDGGDYLLDSLHSAIGERDFIKKFSSHYAEQRRGDVILLTGVGDAFPFMRVHSLLEALQPCFSDTPILVMYPGVFDKHSLQLFGKLQPNDYYRAFNIIVGGSDNANS